MSWRRGKTSGWTAFDQQQKQKDCLELRGNNEPFPSLPGTTGSFDTSERNTGYKRSSAKPFSSVVVPSIDSLAPAQVNKPQMLSEVDSSGGSQSRDISRGSGFGTVFRQLKELYGWADDSLIEDIMVAAANDFDMASSFLKAMVSDETSEDHNTDKAVESVELMTNTRTSNVKKEVSAQTTLESERTFSSLTGAFVENVEKNGSNEYDHQAKKLLDDQIEINAMLGKLTCVPLEPEWEEDDVYLSCRKDAIKTMRAAARHSKAATNSFIRGDHSSAQQYSLKAQEEWESANRLNAKAAREILSIRNESNDIWRLDLHGLHASEAVQALQEHLHMIETRLYTKKSNASSLPNGYRVGADAQSKKWLEVITGVGNHSRGGAALPVAVRTFLTDNGYRIDEARPGVIMVRPKFQFSGQISRELL